MTALLARIADGTEQVHAYLLTGAQHANSVLLAAVPNPMNGVTPAPGIFAKLMPKIHKLLGTIWWAGLIFAVGTLLVGLAKVRWSRHRGNTFSDDSANETLIAGGLRTVALALAPEIVGAVLYFAS